MQLTKLAIARPVVILMLFSALLVLGLKSRSGMTVDLFPNVNFPYAVIVTAYPGAGPEEIETLVTKPIEDNVISVSGLKNLESSSQEGVSMVSMEFELGTEMISTMADVRSKVDAAKMMLPQDATSPLVQKLDIGAIPVLWLGISSARPPKELRDIADDIIKDRLSKIKGVAQVSVSGGDVREIHLNIDKSRLEAYGMSIAQITQALMYDNMNVPGGKITEGSKDYSIRAMGEFDSIDEISDLEISMPNMMGGPPRIIKIGDVAEIKDTVAERQTITRLQEKDSIGILIQKQSDANTIDVANAVKRELQNLKIVLPKDVTIAVAYDQSDRVKEAMADVNTSLILGALLAVLIVFIFLHNLRGTFIVAIAIPISMISAYIPISFAGFTMNMMVMLAFSLAVGILVDDSIVVLENIYRHLDKGEPPAEAALNGRNEIGLAAVAITTVDVVVFVPIAFMGGIVGMMFKEFGITVAVATLFSLLVSFTLTPMLASRWYKQNETSKAKKGFFKWFDDSYKKVDNGYRRMLEWALRKRGNVLLIVLATIVLITVIAFFKTQSEFVPRIDNGRISINIEMPAGTSIHTTDSVAGEVEKIIAKVPDVDNIFTTIGSSGLGRMSGGEGANYAQISMALKQKESVMDRMFSIFNPSNRKRIKSDELIADEVRNMLKNVPGGKITVKIDNSMAGESPIDIVLTGTNTDELNNVSQEIREIVAGVPGIINADVSWKVGKPEIMINIDKLKASNMGLSTLQVASVIRTSLAGNTDSKFREDGKEYDIRVHLNEFDRDKLDDVQRIVVGSNNGMAVYLQDIADIKSSVGPTKIDRKNRQRKVSVTADLMPGYKLASVQMQIEKSIANVDMGGVERDYGGEIQMMIESGKKLIGALVLSILLVYMLMAALFESLLNPFIIMLSVPLAIIGAILGLIMTGETLNIVSMIGIIMLIGLVTKNAILLVDYTNTLRGRGMERNPAILEAGPTRLRPILMTTFAMIFGMLPTAIKLGRGSELRAPMAIAVIGGLIVSTLLTLILIPVMYTYMDDLVNWIQKTKNKLQKPINKDKSSGDDVADKSDTVINLPPIDEKQ